MCDVFLTTVLPVVRVWVPDDTQLFHGKHIDLNERQVERTLNPYTS